MNGFLLHCVLFTIICFIITSSKVSSLTIYEHKVSRLFLSVSSSHGFIRVIEDAISCNILDALLQKIYSLFIENTGLMGDILYLTILRLS